jgi:hypothetical protein
MDQAPMAPTRSLVAVLRQTKSEEPATVRLLVGRVQAIPDTSSVSVVIGGATVQVPRLASFTPTVGKPAYLLSAGGLTIAIGTVNP